VDSPEHGLSDLQVDGDGVVLRDLRQRGAAALDSLDPPGCIATLVQSFDEVRALLRGTSYPVVSVALELAPETQAELLARPAGSRVLSVAERINLTGMAHLLEQYWAPDGGLPHVALESRELAALRREGDVLIHSLHARQTMPRIVPRGRQRIELHFVMNPVSVALAPACYKRSGPVGRGRWREPSRRFSGGSPGVTA
jgi:hypothetical protein